MQRDVSRGVAGPPALEVVGHRRSGDGGLERLSSHRRPCAVLRMPRSAARMRLSLLRPRACAACVVSRCVFNRSPLSGSYSAKTAPLPFMSSGNGEMYSSSSDDSDVELSD